MELLITGVIALFVSFISAPLVRRLAFRFGAVQIPKDARADKKSPIALLGGFAMIMGFFAAYAYNLASGDVTVDRDAIGMFVGIAVLIVCGVVDDRGPIGWQLKFVFQFAAAILFVAITGDRIDFLTNPFAHGAIVTLPLYVSWPVTVMWIVVITNAINFIDGLDGLATGVSCISALSLLFVAITAPELTLGAAAPLMLAAIAGTTLGFLPFNFNPARMFMGETGAAFLGFMLAAVSLQGLLKSYAAISLAIPILIIGLPIFNIAFVSLRRIMRRTSPTLGDKSHLHDKLIEMGLTQRQSVMVLYIASAGLGLVGIVFANKNYLSGVALLVLLPLFVFVVAKFFLGSAPAAEASQQEAEAEAEAAASVAAPAPAPAPAKVMPSPHVADGPISRPAESADSFKPEP